MTRFLLLFLLIVATARFFWRLVAAVARAASAAPSGSAQGSSRAGRSSAPPAAVKMQPCPVCGTYVVPGKAISAVSSGTVVYFCSDTHRAEYQSR